MARDTDARVGEGGRAAQEQSGRRGKVPARSGFGGVARLTLSDRQQLPSSRPADAFASPFSAPRWRAVGPDSQMTDGTNVERWREPSTDGSLARHVLAN